MLNKGPSVQATPSHPSSTWLFSQVFTPQVPDLSSPLGPCQAPLLVLMYNPPWAVPAPRGHGSGEWPTGHPQGQQPCPWTSPLAAVYPGRHLPWVDHHQHSVTHLESKYWPWEKLKRNTCSDLRHAFPQWKFTVPHIKWDSSENSILFQGRDARLVLRALGLVGIYKLPAHDGVAMCLKKKNQNHPRSFMVALLN